MQTSTNVSETSKVKKQHKDVTTCLQIINTSDIEILKEKVNNKLLTAQEIKFDIFTLIAIRDKDRVFTESYVKLNNATNKLYDHLLLDKTPIYRILKSHTRRTDVVISGTLEYLTSYFSYKLSVGNSHNEKIPTKPKTIRAFIKALSKSYSIVEGRQYERTFIELLK